MNCSEGSLYHQLFLFVLRKLVVAGEKDKEHHIYMIDESTSDLDESVVVKNVENVTALALDTKKHKIYWYSHTE